MIQTSFQTVQNYLTHRKMIVRRPKYTYKNKSISITVIKEGPLLNGTIRESL